MALFKKNRHQRRIEVRRNIPTGSSRFVRWFGRPGAIGSLAITVVFFLSAAAMDIWPLDPLPYRAGEYVPQDITARVEFKRCLEKKVAEEIRLAREKEPATFNIITNLLDDITTSIENLPGSFQAAKTPDKVSPDLLKQLGVKPAATETEKSSSENKSESAQDTTASPKGKDEDKANPIVSSETTPVPTA